MSTILRLQKVSKWYGPVLGISEVSFDVVPGVYGLLGMNGAGKSTILKLAAGLIHTNLGTVEVLGESPWSSTSVRGSIGFCPDVDQFYERMSGLAWVTHMAGLMGLPSSKAKQRAEELLATVGMTARQNDAIGSYSKGMRQRTKLARALVNDPKLLLLDEPMTGLDPVARRDMTVLLKQLGEQDRAIIVSSHVLSEVESVTTRMLLIHQGRLLAEGTAKDIRGQLDTWPHRVQIDTPKARELGAKLVQLEGVVSVEFFSNRVLIETGMLSDFYDHLTDLASDPALEVQSVHQVDEGLEAVFRYLVKR